MFINHACKHSISFLVLLCLTLLTLQNLYQCIHTGTQVKGFNMYTDCVQILIDIILKSSLSGHCNWFVWNCIKTSYMLDLIGKVVARPLVTNNIVSLVKIFAKKICIYTTFHNQTIKTIKPPRLVCGIQVIWF